MALATRSTGIVLCLPLLFEIWRKRDRYPRRAIPLAGACLVLATSGLWLYMTYLWFAFKSPLAFLTDRRAWQNGTAPGSELLKVLVLIPFRHLIDVWKAGPDPGALAPWFFLASVLVVVWFRRWLSRSLLLYALGALLLPYIAFNSPVGFVPFTRYIMLAFPVFVLAGRIFQERLWLGFGVIGLSAAMLFMYTAFYAQYYWVG